MTKAQCYYEILGVSETATGDEIKKAYKTQALVWHPDKNQTNPDEAHARFQAILKAYETLSDDKERDWYDRHKDQILSDGDKDNVGKSINLFQYFSSACYANFDDSDDGFYTVYRKVFEEITQEELQAIKQSNKFYRSKGKLKSDDVDDSYPTFGKSDSSYEDVVRPFYAFWSGFCSQLTFDHLDKYNTTEAENRKIYRLMEKENKKVKDAAKKEHNTNIRNLVEFVKKRDKRLKAHKLLVDQQNELNRQKTLEKQRQQREKSLKQLNDYKPSSWIDMNDIEEQLRQLESEYGDKDLRKSRRERSNNRFNNDVEETDSEHDDTDGRDATEPGQSDQNLDEIFDDNEEDAEQEEEGLFFVACPACNKRFKSVNAFENHELSKKHKQNVQRLTKLLKSEESRINK